MNNGFIYLATAFLLLLCSKIGVTPVAFKKKMTIVFLVGIFTSLFFFIAVNKFKLSVFLAIIIASFIITASFHWLAFKRWN